MKATEWGLPTASSRARLNKQLLGDISPSSTWAAGSEAVKAAPALVFPLVNIWASCWFFVNLSPGHQLLPPWPTSWLPRGQEMAVEAPSPGPSLSTKTPQPSWARVGQGCCFRESGGKRAFPQLRRLALLPFSIKLHQT